jgi:glycosyltransferase involved in cell wall biosynthesis
VDAAWAVSEYNASELASAGFSHVKVFPLLFSSASLDLPPDPNVLGKFTADLATWLFVGRLAPNKKVETLIEAYYWYHKTINPYSRLVVVGSERSCPRYFAMLRMFVGDLDLPNVCFEGFASPAGLPAYYRMADVFLTTSEHEGYCAPLLEAMYVGVPVVARAIGGIPEAMGGAGVLYDGMTPNELAGLVNRVIADQDLRNEVLASQDRRMKEIRLRDPAAELKSLLAGLL